jgi:hypothetical protein
MSLLWLEGWEASCFDDTLSRYYDAVTIGSTFTDVANGGATLTSGTAARITGQLDMTTPVLSASNQTDFIIGFAFRAGDAIGLQRFGEDPVAFGFANSDGEQCRIEFYDDDPSPAAQGQNFYRIRFMRGATELCATDQAFYVSNNDEDWIYFEFKVSINNSTGSVVGRYRYTQKPSRNPSGGWTTLTWDAANTSLDTQNQTSAGADRMPLTLCNCRFDDWYVCDNTGTKNNDYLGKVVIVPQKPAGDGATTDFDLAGGASSTQDAWDEPVDSNVSLGDDGDRLSTDATNEVHLATMDAVSGLTSAATIHGLRLDLVARMETAGDLDIVHRYRKTTGTPAETDGGSFNVATTAYEAHSDIQEDDPNTATAWDIGDLDSYQFGARNGG